MKRQVKLNLRELIDTFDMEPDAGTNYLDLETGKTVLVTEDDESALGDFENDVELGENDDPVARFEAWLEKYDYPDWQVDSIRDAFLAQQDIDSRFVQIPRQDSHEGYEDMVAFAETVGDKHLEDLLFVALNGRGAFHRFKDVLVEYPEHRDKWFKFKEERVKERVLEWLDSQEVEVEEKVSGTS